MPKFWKHCWIREAGKSKWKRKNRNNSIRENKDEEKERHTGKDESRKEKPRKEQPKHNETLKPDNTKSAKRSHYFYSTIVNIKIQNF